MRVLQNYNQQNSSDYTTGALTNADRLTNISRLSNTSANRQERVLSPGHNLSIPSPAIVSFQRSQSKNSSRHHTPNESPIQLKSEDIY